MENTEGSNVQDGDFVRANLVAMRVQIERLQLLELVARVGPTSEDTPAKVRLLQEATAELDKKKLLISVRAGFSFLADHGDSTGGADPAIVVRARYLVVYSVDSIDGLDDQHIDSFGRLNGLYNSWPFWRELLQNTLSRMNLPPFMLPVMRPTKIVPKTPLLQPPASEQKPTAKRKVKKRSPRKDL